jgi:hypothetical protein
MPRHPGGERYELQLVALADGDAPAIVRLRHVLKALLRHYGFRAEAVRQLPATPPGVAGTAAAGRSPAPSGDGPAEAPTP